MKNSFDEKILEEANDWVNTNQKVVLATVIQTWGSSPRQVGSRMIVNEKGDFSGSVSGGCVESAVVRECISLIKDNKPCKKIEFKIPEKSSYQKHPNPASRYAVVGVYVAKHKDGTRVAVTGAKPCVYNDKDLSKALDNNFSTNSIAGMELKSSDMNSDIHASAEYRANLVVIQAKKAVEAC